MIAQTIRGSPERLGEQEKGADAGWAILIAEAIDKFKERNIYMYGYPNYY